MADQNSNPGNTCSGGGCGNNNSISPNQPDCDDSGIKRVQGRGGGAIEQIIRQLNDVSNTINNFNCDRTLIDGVKYIPTGVECSGEFATKNVDGIIHRCVGGEWMLADTGILRDNEPNVSSLPQNTSALATASATTCATPAGSQNSCSPVPIYADDGCTVIGYKPFKYSDGKFGIWLTDETYPKTENCECKPIYGTLAGERVRLHRAPSVSKEPFFLNKRTGVPSEFDLGNTIEDEAFVFMIGSRFENIKPPENLPKPLCPDNPYSIVYVERTEANKSIIASGLMTYTFHGKSQGEDYAVPKHGINSPEFYDTSLNPNDGNGNRFYRGGEGETPIPAFNFHSPDTHFLRPNLDPWLFHLEGEVFGTGWRHGLYAKGDKPSSFFIGRKQQKGARQSINMNKWQPYKNTITQCVRGMANAPADSIVSNEDTFTWPLMNLWRESSVYVELSGSKPQLSTPGTITPQTNGADNNFNDNSFEGDTELHKKFIYGRALYGTFRRFLPRQYGSPIGQTFIPLGMEATSRNLSTGVIEGLYGDSFTGCHSFKRTGYVSDKNPESISQVADFPGAGGDLPIIGGLIRFLWRILGVRNCGHLPDNDDGSPLNQQGGLNGRPGFAGQGDDIYFPSVVKTAVYGWFSSDANVDYFRGTGAVDEVRAEVHARRLKSLDFDSTMPENDFWQNGWLNRFYVQWDTPAGFKKLMMTILLFLLVYGIGLWIIIEGIKILGAAVFGLSNSILAAIFGAILVALGIGWIILWANSDLDNRLIANFLGIDLCWPDKIYPEDSQGSRYAQKRGRVRQFEDNYYEYNIDYNCKNTLDVAFGMGDPYFTCVCPEKRNNNIFASNPQNPNVLIDSWRNFEPNNLTTFPLDLGSITNMFTMQGRLYAHTTDNIVSIPNGRGEVFGQPAALNGGVKEGFGGLLDGNAACVTQWGYIYPDREARKWYIFDGGSNQVVPYLGIEDVLDEHMNFKLLEKFPDFKVVDQKTEGGIGYSFGLDNQLDRLILTKRDYIPLVDGITLSDDGCVFMFEGSPIKLTNEKYFCENHLTVSYDPKKREWISYHFYHPVIWHWNRFNLWSFNNGMWKHNIKGSFQNFYGEPHPFIIDFVVNDLQTLDQFTVVDMMLDVESQEWRDCDYIKSTCEFFDNGHFYNTCQSTGEINFKLDEKNKGLSASTSKRYEVKVEREIRKFKINEFFDNLTSEDDFIICCNPCHQPKEVNEDNHGKGEIEDFVDNYFHVRLTYFNEGNVKMIAKRTTTSVNIETQV